jgi:hypothetical protein
VARVGGRADALVCCSARQRGAPRHYSERYAEPQSSARDRIRATRFELLRAHPSNEQERSEAEGDQYGKIGTGGGTGTVKTSDKA